MIEFELDGADRELLGIACRVRDRVAWLQAVVDDSDGVLSKTRLGEVVASPACRELRQQEAHLGKLLASLRVVGDAAEDDAGRPQKRSGFRGAYNLCAVQ